MTAYYNENDPKTAAWLRELIKVKLIAKGVVDERNIEDVHPADLRGYTQCHFFAGIGGWSYALRNAGWPDDTPVWTGSCPCQSFSTIGKGEGFSDKRHLWPAWFRLVSKCKPDTIFGEQVASSAGLGWLDVVSADLEGKAYAFGAADLCAAGLGAPHIRQRLYWVAHSKDNRTSEILQTRQPSLVRYSPAGFGAFPDSFQTKPSTEGRLHTEFSIARISEHSRLERQFRDVKDWRGPGGLDPLTARSVAEAGATRGNWADCDWWYGQDGKYRPIEPGIFPLVNGAANHVLKLRGYGNAIVPEVAQTFIESYLVVMAENSQSEIRNSKILNNGYLLIQK